MQEVIVLEIGRDMLKLERKTSNLGILERVDENVLKCLRAADRIKWE